MKLCIPRIGKKCGFNNHSSGSNNGESNTVELVSFFRLLQATAQSYILTGTKNYTAIEHGWPKIKTLVWNADAGMIDTVPAVPGNGKMKGQKKGLRLLSSHAYNADTWWRKFGCHYMWTRKGGKSKDAMLSMTTLLLIMWGRCFLAKVFAPGLLQLRTLELWLWRHGTLEIRNACMHATSLWRYSVAGSFFPNYWMITLLGWETSATVKKKR